MKRKVVYIVSDIDKALAFEWVATHLNKDLFDLSFILIDSPNSYLSAFLKEKNIPVKHVTYRSARNFFFSFFSIWKHLLFLNPDVVHCHLRTAEILGMPAALLAGVSKRIYTRHSSTYNHLYHPKGVRVDKVINRMASDIIAISENVKNVLIDLEGVPEKKVNLIHHGFDFTLFENVPQEEILELKNKYQIPEGRKVIGLIARYIEWKGYQYSIPAISRVLDDHPDVHLLIANAKGKDEGMVKSLIKKHIPEGRVTEIVFENNLPAVYECMDYYVHVPIDESVEAFGQTYVEALLAKVCSVFTLSGVAKEFIEHEKNALVVDFKNSQQIYAALKELINNPEMCKKITESGVKSVEKFSLAQYIDKLERLYLS